eukprot:augustus_masked-scaffold_5-processed-gene-0.37-mRNA-1 protein AED:1.00 eAED:1.00 QI:0/-1/0/0/-1/1/1/0/324
MAESSGNSQQIVQHISEVEETVEQEQETQAPPVNTRKRQRSPPSTLTPSIENDEYLEGESQGDENQEKHVKPVVKVQGNRGYSIGPYEDSKFRRGRNRRFFLCKIWSFIFLALFLIATPFAIIQTNQTTTSALQTSENSTSSPTAITQTPSLSPTFGPSKAPSFTRSPSSSPVEEGPVQSALSCADLQISEEITDLNRGNNNFLIEDGVCADVFAGEDPEYPNRNHWNARTGRRDCPEFDHEEAEEKCESVGARLCTREEFEAGVGLGTGCGSDNAYLWSMSECANGAGYLKININLKGSDGVLVSCRADLKEKTVLKCCGDDY